MMTKTASSKKRPKPSSPKVDPITVESKKCKKLGSEIDEIFACKKRKKPEKDSKANTGKPSSTVSASNSNLNKMNMVKKIKKKKPVKDNTSSGDHLKSRPRKKTADGFSIYTEEELGFGNQDAGGTRLCPFDCDCCF